MHFPHRTRRPLALLLPALVLGLSACGDSPADEEAAPEVSTQTVAGLIADEDDLSAVESLLNSAGMAAAFDGAASYTVFAPTNAAFDALDEDFTGEEARPALLAVLRGHIVPGFLTLEDLAAAVDTQGGPVEMQTMAETTLSFSMEGDQLMVTTSGGEASAAISDEMLGANGVVVPVDTVLKDLTPAQ